MDDSKIAILGFGVEGKSAYKYLKEKNPEFNIDIFDEKTSSDEGPIVTKVENFSDIDFDLYNMVVRSPGINPKKIVDSLNHKNNLEITSATKIFFDKCPAPIIGVTGTKGKGSTSSFIYEIIKNYFESFDIKRKVYLVGNIGLAALDILSNVNQNDIIVYELSSFQLWDINKSPHIAVFTMLEPDHLDVHEDFNEYSQAKFNIFRYQTKNDWAVVNRSLRNKLPELNGKTLYFPEDKLDQLARKSIKVVGEHQIENAEAAILSVKTVLPEITDDQIKNGLTKFTGLAHRLKFVAEKNGIKYYDDSIATTPGSAIAAIKSFDDQSKILILGGFDKGADYTTIGTVAEEKNVKEIFVIGSNQDKVAEQIRKKYSGEVTKLSEKNMNEIVKKITSTAKPGDNIIMSPAAASFDMFKNYKDRGEKFISAVESL